MRPLADTPSSVENSDDMEIDPAGDLSGTFPSVQEQIHVDENVHAEPSRLEDELVDTDNESEDTEYGCDKRWLYKIKRYIANGVLPSDKWAARKLRA
ncbi:unnamed protein product [Arabis nemorensis]|uniref:Uncharacterized protein n=1 Tax=Arabis nemorensis TaxID=586526 RepID=A0A565CQ61_9BRAS|nr:unnamed protein product [Arabis nemorensis]